MAAIITPCKVKLEASEVGAVAITGADFDPTFATAAHLQSYLASQGCTHSGNCADEAMFRLGLA
jgi:hypothetical protein